MWMHLSTADTGWVDCWALSWLYNLSHPLFITSFHDRQHLLPCFSQASPALCLPAQPILVCHTTQCPRNTYFQPSFYSACLSQIIDSSPETIVVLLSSCQMFSSSSWCARAWKYVPCGLIYTRKDFRMWYLSEDGK